MNTTSRWSASLLAAGACVLATLHSVQGGTEGGEVRDSAALMKELSSDFTALEKEIRAGNSEGMTSALAYFRAAYPR